MNKPSEELIFDRTQQDVDDETLKGQWNASDLNRVETWCRYLADELADYGYTITITTKTNWVQSDKRRAVEMERIRSNIRKIMTGYHYLTNIEPNAEFWNYTKANNWEKILSEINTLMVGMSDYFIYAGVSNAGQERLWQNRFRRQYTPKWYLQSTGTQYIDTGIKSQVGIKIEMDFEPEQNGQVWCGSHFNSPNMSLLCKSDGTWGYVVDATIYYGNSSVQLQRQKVSFEMNSSSQNIKVNGSTVLSSSKSISGVSNANLYLFCRNESSISSLTKASMKLYEAKIYLDGTLLRHFIPVLDTDNVACLYDLVSQEYFYNIGTGNFNCV